MKILTIENKEYEMDKMPDVVDDLRYCVLDYSNALDVDYYFLPLIFLESFSSPSVLLQIGDYRIQLPLDWSLIIGDPTVGDLEILEISKLNDRNFYAFSYNPIESYSHSFLHISILNIFTDVKWYLPKLKYGHLLAVPVGTTTKNTYKKTLDCIFIVKETTKVPDVLDFSKLV